MRKFYFLLLMEVFFSCNNTNDSYLEPDFDIPTEQIEKISDKILSERISYIDIYKGIVKGYEEDTTLFANANLKSLQRLGAKRDNIGFYFEFDGGYRGYVHPYISNGVLGIEIDDIQFMIKYGIDNKILYEKQDREKIKIIAMDIWNNINGLNTIYNEKGGTDDLMKDDHGVSQSFYLGEFYDLNFSETAIADFMENSKGSKGKGCIHYWIVPSKDRIRTNKILIKEVVSKYTVANNWEKEGLKDLSDKNFKRRIFKYGEVIYHKGQQNPKWGTLKSEKKFTDWQPICDLNNVRLTPQAKAAEVELFVLLNLGKLSKNSKGHIIDEAGNELTKKQLEKAAKYGILNKRLNTDYEINGAINKAQEKASIILKNSASKRLKNYLADLGLPDTATTIELQNFYEKNKDSFSIVGDKIIDVIGVQWGTVKDDIVEIFDFDTIISQNQTK